MLNMLFELISFFRLYFMQRITILQKIVYSIISIYLSSLRFSELMKLISVRFSCKKKRSVGQWLKYISIITQQA